MVDNKKTLVICLILAIISIFIIVISEMGYLGEISMMTSGGMFGILIALIAAFVSTKHETK
ncbi:MAG: hypothetical protein FWG88_00610 [Oscillospiraceae bacterium]|nr:hypothetical protein [Oscillospiraceae bacterium]